MNTEEKELVMYNIKRQLEELSALPIQDESMFSKAIPSPT